MKNNKAVSLSLLVCLLGACSSNQLKEGSDLKIDPLIRVSNDKSESQSMYQLGRYYQGQNRYEQAIAAYEKSLIANSAFADADNGLGVIYSKMGRYDEANQHFLAALSKSPSAGYIYSNLGYSYFVQGKYEEAKQALIEAVKINPNDKLAQNNLALAYKKSQVSEALVPINDTSESMIDPSAILKDSNIQSSVVETSPSVFQIADHDALNKKSVDARAFNVGRIRLEVSNGNGLTGMAKRVGAFIKPYGCKLSRFTNQKPFSVVHSQVQYRSGYSVEANWLKDFLPFNVELVEAKNLRADINLRLLLGADSLPYQARFF